MEMLRRIIKVFTDWILFTCLFAAICAVGLCMATERLITDNIPSLFSYLHAFVFGCTLMVYNVFYVIKKTTATLSDRFNWAIHKRYWHFLFFFSGMILSAISLFHLSWKMLAGCVVLGFLSFAYSLPMLPFAKRKRLKDFGWIKITVLTGVWTIVTSVLPILYWDKNISDYPFEIILRFVFMFTLCVAFDIRDMQTDLEADIYTLPNLIGLKNSYLLMDITISIFLALSLVQFHYHPSPVRIIGAFITAIATKIAIEYCRRHPSDKAYLGYVDGMMLFYAIMVLLH